MPVGGLTARRGSGAASGPGDIFEDTFTEAAPPVILTAHTPNVGTGWLQLSSSSAHWSINPSGSVWCSTVDNAHGSDVLAQPSVSTSNYTVQATVDVVSASYGSMWLFARHTGVGSGTGIGVLWNVTASICELIVNGSFLGSATLAGVVGTSYVLQLVVAGTSIDFYVGGVLTLSGTSSTYSAAGHAGLGWGTAVGSASTGLHVQGFIVP